MVWWNDCKPLAKLQSGKVFNNRLEMVFKEFVEEHLVIHLKMMPKSEAEAKNKKNCQRCLDFIWHQVLTVNEYIKNLYCSCNI